MQYGCEDDFEDDEHGYSYVCRNDRPRRQYREVLQYVGTNAKL